MLRVKKMIAPVTAIALMLGLCLGKSRADNAAAPTTGKATLKVTVVDSDGKVVPGATVTIWVAPPKGKKTVPTTQPEAKPKPEILQTGKTADDGTASLTKIADGEFVVNARLKGSGTGRATVTVADGKDQTVSITLKVRPKKAAN
jgi:hypothetical protein